MFANVWVPVFVGAVHAEIASRSARKPCPNSQSANLRSAIFPQHIFKRTQVALGGNNTSSELNTKWTGALLIAGALQTHRGEVQWHTEESQGDLNASSSF